MQFQLNFLGPYQCELCQNITDSKEEFVSHIKTKHLEDVDDDVMNTLYTDLKKSRRKMELAAQQDTHAFKEKRTPSYQNLPLTNRSIYQPTS